MNSNLEKMLLPSKNFAYSNLGNVCVAGLGKTGICVAEYLLSLPKKRIDHVHVYAGDKSKESMHAADKLLKMGASVSFDDSDIKQTYDLCIMSPGIPIVSSFYKSAKKYCGEVISEVEFSWREADKNIKWIAVSGTNGKTTTTSLIYHILKNANRRVECIGNIGHVALDAVWADTKKSPYNVSDYYVLEISSYQLALTDKFSPDIAVLLNITPDHISWHGSFDEYVKAKLKIFNNAKLAVINLDDKVIAKNKDEIFSKIKHVITNSSTNKNICINYEGKSIKIGEVDKIKIRGAHNIVNCFAACSVCYALGIPVNLITNGLYSFRPLEHRLEPCGIIAGIRIYNDSKSTNVDSVLVAINSFDEKKAIFLLGGRDKNTDLTLLVKSAYKKLKAVVCYGEASDRIYGEFKKIMLNDNNSATKDKFILKKSEDMKHAFFCAMDIAYPGDFVVLSPGCSSFDEFKNFEQRGHVFKNLVNSFK